MEKKSLDLSQFIPQTDKNPLSIGLFKNIINNHFTNDSTLEDIYGWVGALKNDNSTYVPIDNIDNKLNILEPCLVYTHGSEKYVHTFTDFLKKLTIDGYDIRQLGVDAASKSYTFVVPINYDKFCNYSQYYWYGALTGLTSAYNPFFKKPEYITIANGSNVNDWTQSNFWLHIDDIPNNLSATNMTRATRPIIEYDNDLQLNSYYIGNKPAISTMLGAINYTQKKITRNMYPQFDMFTLDGSFANKTSPIFAYFVDSNSEFDTQLDTYITKISNIFMFKQSLQTDGIHYTYKKSGVQKSLWGKSDTINYPQYFVEDSAGIPALVDPLTDINNIGWYKFPKDFINNAEHAIDNVIEFTNIQQHFAEVMKSQSGFIGNVYGINNYRDLTLDKTKGGTISDTNSDWTTILPYVLSNDNFSTKSIISFMQKSYMQLLSDAHNYVIDNFLDLLSSNETISTTYNQSIFDVYVFDKIKEDLAKSSFSNIFFDTTSGLNFSCITLPYLQVLHRVTPGIKFDDLLNSYAIQHHDGHISKITSIDEATIINLTRKKVLRSDGNTTSGIISPNPPPRPYKNQLWYNTQNSTLYVFNIVSDLLPFDSTLVTNSNVKYYFDRTNNALYSFNGLTYDTVIDVTAPWVECDIGLIIDNAILSIENALYNGVVTSAQPLKIDFTTEYSNNQQHFSNALYNNFLDYCDINNIIDPFKSNYVQNDAFTWNYSNAPLISGLTTQHATWQSMYTEYFGTSRPESFPWILQGYTTKPVWWDTHYSLLPSTSMWNDIINNTGPFAAPNGPWLKKLSVNVLTSELLPPYVKTGDAGSNQALYNMIPLTPYAPFIYGDLCDAEVVWRKSIGFAYALLEATYMTNPIGFIKALISCNNKSFDEYYYDQRVQAKKSFSNNLFFGDTVNRTIFSKIKISAITQGITNYVITCLAIGEFGNIFSIVGTGVNTTFTNNFSNVNISLSTQTNSTCFFVGDVINIDVYGNISYVYTNKFYTNNFLQVLSHYARDKQYDLRTHKISKIYKSCDIKLCHRNAMLFNTQNLELSTDFIKIPQKSYEVILKKNTNVVKYTLDTLRVILKKLGGNQIVNGTRIPIGKADDWEYQIVKIGGLNKNIKYYTFDTNGVASDFIYKNFTFKKYLDKLTLTEATLPINVKGLQNVIDILNGYAEYTKSVGWEINSSDFSANTDEFSNGIVDWDTEISRVISAQYANIISGTGVLFNPFRNNVWFNNSFGVVSSFVPQGIDKNISSNVYDINGDVIDYSALNIFRFDNKCQISSSSIPMNNIVLSLDEYQHVIVFNSYVGSNTRYNLIYDKKYGTVISRLKLITQCSRNNGKPVLHGFYLNNNQYNKNIENNINTIEKLYDIDSYDNDKIFERVQSLIGYKNRTYLEDLEYTNKTQFNFWRGTLKNKGTVSSIRSFNNSNDYGNDAKIYEYWAYRIASYGDARDKNIQTFYINNDNLGNNVNIFSFVQDDLQSFNGDENVLNDNVKLKTKTQLVTIVIDDTLRLYDLPLHDTLSIYLEGIENVLIENVDYTRHNATTISFINASINNVYKVYYTNPNYDAHNICTLINDKDQNVSYIKAFDPIRDVYNCDSLDRIDILSSIDPAICNSVINESAKNIKSFWGAEHLNTIWWDTSRLEYLQYTDDTIYPNHILRHNIWGKMSDRSSININQWISSPVPPQEYVTYTKSKNGILNNASGIPSIKKLYRQKRNWFTSTIGWKYSDNPHINTIHEYTIDNSNNNNNNNITFEKNVIGDKYNLFIEDISWNNIDLSKGLYISPIDTAGNIQGQVYIPNASNVSNVCGSSTVLTTPTLIDSAYIDLTRVEISNSASIGSYLLSNTDNGGDSWSITCTSASTGISETLDVLDVSNTIGFVIKYDFKNLGVKVFAKTLVDHADVSFDTISKRKQAIATAIGNINHDLFVRSTTLCTYTNHITTDFVVNGWVGYNLPTQIDLDSDNPQPYNKWEAVQSTPVDILKNGFTFTDITKGLTFVTKNNTIQKYSYTLDESIIVEDVIITKKYNGDNQFFGDNFDIGSIFNVSQCLVEVYLNGIRLKSIKDYVIINNVLDILPNITLSIGDTITCVIKAYNPLDNMFNVSTMDTSDEYLFTINYPCTVIDDVVNGILTPTYYFWAYYVIIGTITTNGIKEDLSKRNKAYFSIDKLYNDTYTNINIHNSHNLTKSQTYTKIGIMNDASLRDDVNGVDFKNKHHEWKLIHQNMSEHISKKLWDSLTYSLSGFDRAGNIIPNIKYTDYDIKNGTNTRFGFDTDKTLLDKNISLITLKNSLISLNDWSTLSFIDQNNIDNSFNTPVKIINTMNKIYDITNYKIPNKIFFDLLDDIVALGYHMTELFKTSYIEIEYSQIA